MNKFQKVSEYFGESVQFPLDGNIHRFGRKKEFWAIGRAWEYKGNFYWQIKYGNFKDANNDSLVINSWDDKVLSKNESKSIRENTKEIQVKAELEKQEKYKTSRDNWTNYFNKLPIDSELHEYCKHKGLNSNYIARVSNITNEEIGLYPGTLCIPVYNSLGQVAGVQRIYKKNNEFHKRYCYGLELKGSICPIGRFKNSEYVYLAEGFATAASIYMATKVPTVICFQANNIEHSISTIRKINPNCKIVICADRDLNSDKIGEKKAKDASKKFPDCIVRVVEFPEGSQPNWSDFNDLHQFVPNGLNKIKEQLSVDVEKFEEEEFKKDIANGFTKKDEETNKTYRQYHRLLEYLEHKYHYKYMAKRKQIIIWNGKYYEKVEDQWIKSFAQKHFNYPLCEKDSERLEFLNLVKSKNLTNEIFSDSSTIKNMINLNNGVYDYVNETFLKHDPSRFFDYCLPVDYDPFATCPTWDKLLNNLTMNRGHLKDVIEEFIGFSISNMEYNRYNKALIFEGTGANGKTTLIRIIENLCGSKNCASASLSELTTNRFLTSHVIGKLVNFSEEEPKKVFSDSGPFKRLTGGSSFFAEEKGKAGFNAKNKTKLIISYNEIPFLPDSSKGMKRRLIVVPFELNLDENPDKKIDNVENILMDEMSGILNAALFGLKRLLKNDSFTKVPESDLRIELMLDQSDAVREFIKTCTEITENENDRISTTILYDNFLEFTGNKTRISKIGFSKKINKYCEEKNLKIENRNIYYGQSNIRCKGYIGIKLLDA